MTERVRVRGIDDDEGQRLVRIIRSVVTVQAADQPAAVAIALVGQPHQVRQ